MTSFRVALAGIAAAAALLASAAAAFASPGLITSNVNVRSGPGTGYNQVGVLRSGENVDVSQCGNGWCYVQSGNAVGWVAANFVAQTNDAKQDPGFSFGVQIGPDGKPSVNIGVGQQPPAPPVTRPAPPPPSRPLPPPPLPDDDDDDDADDVAQACFYSGTNFSGDRFCVEQGDSVPLLRRSWNDRIRSVEVLNGATVDMCADRDLVGICQTIDRNRLRLAPQLDRRISSVEVY